jgi:hypothetical protein
MYVPRAPERRHGRVRQPALLVDARVLVLVAEDELARGQRPPAAVALRDAPAVALVLADSLDGGLAHPVGEAEVLALAAEQLGVQLVDDRHAVRHRVLAEREQRAQEQLLAAGVDRGERVRRAGPEPVLPGVGRARVDVAQRARPRGHAAEKLRRERRQHRRRHAERGQSWRRHGEVERRVGLYRPPVVADPPRLGVRHVVDEPAQPAPPVGAFDVGEEVRRADVVVAVGAQDVALDVGQVQRGRGKQHQNSRS